MSKTYHAPLLDMTGEQMSVELLEKRIDVDTIPTLPSIAMEAISLMEGEESNFDSIADLIKNDQVLSGRILHYANSAYIGARNEVTTISRAISLLGFSTVRSIILSVSVFDCFSDRLAEQKGSFVNFWIHSIGVASTAELLAKKLGFPNPETAYLAGLVHDMGKLVCFLQFPEQFEQVCLELESLGGYSVNSPLALDIENEFMGINHAEVGRVVAKQWMFPEPMAKAMWLHHQPVFETIMPEETNMHQLIRFADVLCVAHNIGSSYFLSSSAYDHQHYHFALENLLHHHHLTADEIDEIIHNVMGRVKELVNILGFCDQDIYRNLVSSANISLGSMSIGLERKNKELASANRVLDATYKMTRRLKSGLSISEAIHEILLSAGEAFGVSRCLCMAADHQAGHFVGQIYSMDGFDDFIVPITPKSMTAVGDNDIEIEAVKRLRRASTDFSEGQVVDSGVADIVSGSQFMASFFVADKKSNGRPERIIGELMVDFQDDTVLFENMGELSRNFEVLSTAAANGIERILLEKDLLRHSQKMADASRKMEESQRQLFNTHRLATVGRLAAGAAHEINNPLTIISLNLQVMDRMLAMDELDKEEVGKRLGVISAQEHRISKIISQLMGFAKPSEPQFGAANVAQIIDKVLSVIGDRVAMGKIKLVNEVAADLPMVLVDATQIEQVVMNLLINANHSMPDGGVISLKAKVFADKWVEVSVSDTGMGISRENLAKVFDPFFTTKKEGEGTGLGLAVCHTIMEHNGGTLKVNSVEGEGCVFSATMPIDKGSRLKAMKRAVDQKKKQTPVSQDECRVLIVDDEHLLNNMLQECLVAAGYEVDGAYDGVEAIGMLRFKKYHLVLLDIRMPRKDGLEVLQFVRDEYPDVPVIIITGLASMEEIKDTVNKGAFACLKKPFLLETVLEKVNLALASKCKPKLPAGS